MSLWSQSLSENRRTLALAIPIVAGFVGQMLMGWADTIMVGRVGVTPLAAAAFANTLLMVPMVFGFGFLSGVSVRASHAHGGGRPDDCARALRSGLLLALLTGLAVAALIQVLSHDLSIFGEPAEATIVGRTFLVLCGWSIIPVFLTTAAKYYSEALGRPWMPFWIMIGAVLVNIGLNWVLIYGNLGAPALGLTGAGIATLIARTLAMLGVLGYVFFAPVFDGFREVRMALGQILAEARNLLKIGLPTGTMHFAEVSGFAICSLMMGWLSVDALAAHQIAITCAATTFMVPLGIAQAVSVRIGQARGGGELPRCAPILVGALLGVTAMMSLFMVAFIAEGDRIAAWFVGDRAVVILAAHLLVFAGFFQVVDGIQVICAAALRGFEDTRVPMLIGVLSYWGVALPVSYLLGVRGPMGPGGVWLGLVAGLTTAAGALAFRAWHRIHLSAKA